MMVDITQFPEVVSAVNAILNNGGAAEIKLEHNKSVIVVVEPQRTIKYRNEIKREK